MHLRALWDWWSRVISLQPPSPPSAGPWQNDSLSDIEWPFALTFQKYSGHPPHQWPFPQFYICFARIFYYKTMSSKNMLSEHLFCMVEVRELLPHLLLVADRSFTTSKPVHTCYTMNTNIYANKWRNLSTNRLLPTVLLLSLSSVSILNYAKLQ